MANMIDWNLVLSETRRISEQYQCESENMAFLYLCISSILGISGNDVEDSITEGSKDRGIDAVYIEEGDDKTIIHLFQVKHTNKLEKMDNNFPSSEIDKLLSFISDLLKKDVKIRNSCNAILWEKIQQIWEIYDKCKLPQVIIHLCSNMGPLTSDEASRLINGIKPYRHIRIIQHDIANIVELITKKDKNPINRTIRLVDNQYFERSDGNIRGLVATIEAIELIKLITDPENPNSVLLDIFDDNVRVYLTNKNPINKKIIESALSKTNHEFWYLNNGITITCDSFQYPPGMRTPNLELINVQIVNGGQTSNALFEAFRKDPESLRRVLILVRIYETKNRDISQRIAESTNRQTPINSRDLRSNDDIQKKLELMFLNLGYYYERKAQQHKDQAKNKRIDAIEAGQAYLAYYLDAPHTAYAQKYKVFGELYDNIFNEETTAQKLLAAFLIYRKINELKHFIRKAARKGEEYDEKLRFIIEGSYFALFTISFICRMNNIDPDDIESALSQLDNAINIIAKIVAEHSKKDHDFSFKSFFKSTQSIKALKSYYKQMISQEAASAAQ